MIDGRDDGATLRDGPDGGSVQQGAPSRSGRILGAVGLGYVAQLVTVTVGLWLTPFLLRQLGATDYGLWLLALQTMTYLGLLDLGVVALLPRETAFTVGRAENGLPMQELSGLVGRTLAVVLCQLPIVAVVAVVVLLQLPTAWQPMQGPLCVIIGCFLFMFPLRTMHAVLQGLQETPFLGRVSLLTWIIGTLCTIALVVAGFRLYAVAIGWAVSQVLSAFLWGRHLHTRFRGLLPARIPRVTRASLAHWLGSGVWVSVAQIAQVLLAGTDIFIIGKFLGPAAIVPYAVTGKLIAVLANQPQIVMQAAQPALSEVRASEGERHRLVRMTTALSQLMLLISGLVFVVVLAVNEGFVTWWIGAPQYAGSLVTLGLLGSMLLRHWNTTAVYSLFAFGNERRIALTALADGVVTVGVAAALVGSIGSLGAALGSVVGVLLVSLPQNLRALARDTGTTIRSTIRPLANWSMRFIFVAVAADFLSRSWAPRTAVALAMIASLVSMVYALVMLPVCVVEPLGEYTLPRIRTVLARMPYIRSHFAQAR